MKPGNNIIDKICSAPQSPGVYIFKNDKLQYLYVGSSVNLYKRCMEHFLGYNKQIKSTAILNDAMDLSFVVSLDIKEARSLEKKLISEHHPLLNTQHKEKPYLEEIRNIGVEPGYQKFSFELPRGIYLNLKKYSGIRNMTMKDFIIFALSELIKKEIGYNQ